MNDNRIHVSNIPFDYTTYDLYKFYMDRKYGLIYEVELISNERGSKGKQLFWSDSDAISVVLMPFRLFTCRFGLFAYVCTYPIHLIFFAIHRPPTNRLSTSIPLSTHPTRPLPRPPAHRKGFGFLSFENGWLALRARLETDGLAVPYKTKPGTRILEVNRANPKKRFQEQK